MHYGTQGFHDRKYRADWERFLRGGKTDSQEEHRSLIHKKATLIIQSCYIMKNLAALGRDIDAIFKAVKELSIQDFTLAINKDPQIHRGARERVLSAIAAKIVEGHPAIDAKLAQIISKELFTGYCEATSHKRFKSSNVLARNGFHSIFNKCLDRALQLSQNTIQIF